MLSNTEYVILQDKYNQQLFQVFSLRIHIYIYVCVVYTILAQKTPFEAFFFLYIYEEGENGISHS